VGGKGGARRAALFAPDFLAMAAQDGLRLVAQDGDLFVAEAARKKYVALLIEGPDLLGREPHGVPAGQSVNFGAF
jgi:hypothetical protein